MYRKQTGITADRREVLKLLSGGLAAVCGSATACAPSTAEAPLTRVAIDAIPAGGRLRVLDGENPVELRRTADGEVAARSLWCTHFGCEVRWTPELGQYLCPCHEGFYDADGRPLSGPPPRPLAAVAVLVQGDQVIVGAGAASSSLGEDGR